MNIGLVGGLALGFILLFKKADSTEAELTDIPVPPPHENVNGKDVRDLTKFPLTKGEKNFIFNKGLEILKAINIPTKDVENELLRFREKVLRGEAEYSETLIKGFENVWNDFYFFQLVFKYMEQAIDAINAVAFATLDYENHLNTLEKIKIESEAFSASWGVPGSPQWEQKRIEYLNKTGQFQEGKINRGKIVKNIFSKTLKVLKIAAIAITPIFPPAGLISVAATFTEQLINKWNPEDNDSEMQDFLNEGLSIYKEVTQTL